MSTCHHNNHDHFILWFFVVMLFFDICDLNTDVHKLERQTQQMEQQIRSLELYHMEGFQW